MTRIARFQTPVRLAIATLGLAVIALGVASIPSAEAGGLRNCVEITGKTSGRVGCFELVWVDGAQRRMTFSNQGFDGATPRALDAFYVLAPRPTPHRGTRPTPSRMTTSSATCPRGAMAPTASRFKATSSSAAVRASSAGPAFHPGRRLAVLRSYARDVRRRPSPDIGRRHRVCGRRGTRGSDQPRP